MEKKKPKKKSKRQKVSSDEKTKPTTKKQVREENIKFSSFPHKVQEKENKQLSGIFICLGVFILIFILTILFIYSGLHFEYEGVKFDVVKEGDIIFYKTALPVIHQEEIIPYNFYLRNDPRELNVSVNKRISFKKNMVIEVTTEELFCDGDWNLAIGNMQKLYGIIKINLLVKNESENYEPKNQYMFIKIQPANITSIEKVGDNSYNLNVNNCEILKVTERLMLETFIRYQEFNK